MLTLSIMLYVICYASCLCDLCYAEFRDRTEGSNDTDRTRGSNDTELEGSTETHRLEGHIVALSGVCVVYGILGNSLSFVLTVLCVMCFRFF